MINSFSEKKGKMDRCYNNSMKKVKERSIRNPSGGTTARNSRR